MCLIVIIKINYSTSWTFSNGAILNLLDLKVHRFIRVSILLEMTRRTYVNAAAGSS